jgi:formate dehydrogenase subunit gamma
VTTSPPHPSGSGGERDLLRFGVSERALHWAFVAPYLVLGATGLLLLWREALGLSEAARERCVWIHEAAGCALVVLPTLVLVVSRPEPFAACLREACRWTLRDIRWLAASGLRPFLPRLTLPAAGRFNAGQKLNLLHVLFLVPALAATGFALWWLAPALLLLRAAHAAGALVSLALASGHMYLALIHPATRRARGAMFHGRVPAAYAEHHHPLWYEAMTGSPAAAVASSSKWVSPLGIGAAIVLVAALALGAYGPARRCLRDALEPVVRPLVAEPLAVLAPAPLHPRHAAVAELVRCTGCHDLAGGVASVKCLSCHDEVERRLASKAGFHGEVGGECARCHADHRERIVALEDRDFNHDRAAFRLLGAHRCHRREGDPARRYLGIETGRGCVSCHEDPHLPHLEQPCEHCHTEAAWPALAASFDHGADTAFPLLGAHAAQRCESCHQRPAGSGAPVLRGTPSACGDCHADPHERPEADCASCHRDAAVWSAAGFDHSRDARFALDARHSPLACGRCHAAADGQRYRFGPVAEAAARDAFRCEGCHAEIERGLAGEIGGELVAASPHAGTVTCVECHAEPAGPAPAVPAAEPCSSCHPADYDFLAVEWGARIASGFLQLPAGPRAGRARSVRELGPHNWEGVVQWLRSGSAR